MNPAIILVRPQMGENIGASARAMANFGLRELRIVAPRDGWPNVRADALAGHALEVVQQAKLFDTTAEAVADLQVVFATSARDRDMPKPVSDAREAATTLHENMLRGVRTGIIFGPERTGLENEDLALADAVLTMDTDARCPSLNLSHAVGIVAYEWSRESLVVSLQERSDHEVRGERGGGTPPVEDHPPATKAEMDGLFGHMERVLDAREYWKEPTKKIYMWKNIRATLMRAQMSGPEVQTWRGIVRALSGE